MPLDGGPERCEDLNLAVSLNLESVFPFNSFRLLLFLYLLQEGYESQAHFNK